MVAGFSIRNHRTLVASMVFLAVYAVLVNLKPSFLFARDGTLRAFGLRNGKSTVLPLWLVSIALAICATLLVEVLLLTLD